MICTITGQPPKYCTRQTASMYTRGCRCDAARQAYNEYQRSYHRRTVCPICLSYTARDSGFCAKCERELKGA